AALADRFRVLRYDMRGHGLTDCSPGPYTIAQLGDDARALLDALGIETAHVCGLSIGGLVAQRLAATTPARVRSLVLCDTANVIGPPSRWDDRIAAIRSGGLQSIIDAVLKAWFTPGFLAAHPDIARGVSNMLVRTPAEGYIGCCYALREADLRADDAKIACPTLVVVGDQDASTPPAAARELCAAIRGARLELISPAAHIPTIEQPAALNRLLLDFLDARADAPRREPALGD
ncbi:MAG TPA: 3-oxoadipate enol-lactonase, partial [Alphaproteobacteria bacterium]|nr:3-oxoadipate enol-lactonase [Alphaproteobacteria bacterium]